MAQNPASSTVCASTEARPSCSRGTESGNPGLRPHCPRHARESTAFPGSPRPSRPSAIVRSVVAADVESAAHRPDRISRPIFDCLIRDVETTLGKQVLNVPIAQRETAIEPDGMLDDDRRKAVTTVRYLAHPETLKHRPCRSHAVNVTMPGRLFAAQGSRAAAAPGSARSGRRPAVREQVEIGLGGFARLKDYSGCAI